MPSVTWKESKGKFASGETAFLGRWIVGGYCWGSFRDKDGNDLPYKATSCLPGLKPILGTYKDQEGARRRVEIATEYWLSWTEKE